MKQITLPFNYAKRHGVFVADLDSDTATITHKPGLTSHVLLELQRRLQRKIVLNPVTEDNFELLLAKAYESGTEAAMEAMTDIEEGMDIRQLMKNMPSPEDLLESQDDAPVIRLINAILTQAIKQGASDVHFETFEDKLTVRYRVDGVLREVLQPPRVLAPLLIFAIKSHGEIRHC